MVPRRTPWSLGTILEYELDAAIAEFRLDVMSSMSREQAWAHHIKNVHQAVNYFPGGKISVTTIVYGRKRQDRTNRFTRYVQHNGRSAAGTEEL